MATKAALAVAVMLCCATAALATECYGDGDCKASKPCEYGKCNYGKCEYKKRPDGYACNDGNPCTVGDKCSYGVCTPGAPKKCASKNQCMTSTCNTYSGKCEESYKPDGSACNDGNPCTVGDKCSYGACTPGAPKKCASKNQCMTSTCNKYSGNCEESYKPEGAACNDGKKCTYNDKCSYGKCMGTYKSCPTTKACTKSYCNPVTGVCKTDTLPDGTPCNDGNSKTEKDKCSYGVCKGTPIYYG